MALYDNDPLVIEIGGNVYRNILGSPFESSQLGRPQFTNRAFGGNACTLQFRIAEGDSLPRSEDHISIIQNFPAGGFSAAPVRLWGGLAGDITHERESKNFRIASVPGIGYDSFFRGEKIVRINTKRLGQAPLSVSAALQLALDQGGLSTGSIKLMDLSVTGDSGALVDFELTELATVEQAINEITQPYGYYWIVNPGNFLFRSELIGEAPPASIATLIVIHRDFLPFCPIPQLSIDADFWIDARFNSFKYTSGPILPTFIEIADSVDTLEAQVSGPTFETITDLPPAFLADSERTVFGPLLPTTARVSALSVVGSVTTVALTIHEERFEEGMTFVEDAAIDLAVEKGDSRYIRLRQAVGLFVPGEPGVVRATEQRWHAYGPFIDAAREAERLSQIVGGTGRSADRAVVPTADDGEAMWQAAQFASARQARIRGAEFKTTENGIYPLQKVGITDTQEGFDRVPAVITEVSYNAIDDPSPIDLAAGKLFEVSAKAELYKPDSAEALAAQTQAKIGTIDPPKPPLVGTAPIPCDTITVSDFQNPIGQVTGDADTAVQTGLPPASENEILVDKIGSIESAVDISNTGLASETIIAHITGSIVQTYIGAGGEAGSTTEAEIIISINGAQIFADELIGMPTAGSPLIEMFYDLYIDITDFVGMVQPILFSFRHFSFPNNLGHFVNDSVISFEKPLVGCTDATLAPCANGSDIQITSYTNDPDPSIYIMDDQPPTGFEFARYTMLADEDTVDPITRELEVVLPVDIDLTAFVLDGAETALNMPFACRLYTVDNDLNVPITLKLRATYNGAIIAARELEVITTGDTGAVVRSDFRFNADITGDIGGIATINFTLFAYVGVDSETGFNSLGLVEVYQSIGAYSLCSTPE